MDLMPKMPPPGSKPPSVVNVPTPPAFTEGERNKLYIPLDHTFVVPTRRILDESNMAAWLKSEAVARYLEFIQVINAAVRNQKNSDFKDPSEVC
jgi:hypothetical protein